MRPCSLGRIAGIDVYVHWTFLILLIWIFAAQLGASGDPAAAVSSLKPMISKWEHDRAQPDENNRRLLAAVLRVTVEDLGLAEDPDFVW